VAIKASKSRRTMEQSSAASTDNKGSDSGENRTFPLIALASQTDNGSQTGAGSHGDGNSTFALVADIGGNESGSHGGENDPFPLVALTSRIVSAHVAGNSVASAELPGLISSVHGALQALATPTAPSELAPTKLKPAVAIRSSIQPDHIVCLEDGRKLKLLTRHLRSKYDLSPEQYRTKWGLPKDYPMAAADFIERRRQVALATGLGRRNALPPGSVATSARRKAEKA
jgi:predicted transcriptional regulator